MIGKCILKEQSAFVLSRSIIDNALIASEVVHCLHCKRHGNIGATTLKLDISKAYDRVSWAYLLAVLRRMGFAEEWIKWIMMCVSSVNYTILVNNEPVGLVASSRGLRQEDPLSPYIYILCAEGLSALIKNAKRHGLLCNIPKFHFMRPSINFGGIEIPLRLSDNKKWFRANI